MFAICQFVDIGFISIVLFLQTIKKMPA